MNDETKNPQEGGKNEDRATDKAQMTAKSGNAASRGGSGAGNRHYARPASSNGRPGAPAGERHYGKPAAPTGERHYGKPAAPTGEKRYARPATGGRPASAAPAGERHYGKPAAPAGEKRYARPATGGRPASAAPAGERHYSKSAAPTGEKRYARPATGGRPASAAPAGERHYSKSAAPAGERHYGKPAAPTGEKRYARPATGGRPASAAPTGEKRYARPATGGRPASAAPAGERHYGKPAAPTGEKRYARPATGGRPAGNASRSFAPRESYGHAPAIPVETTGLTVTARRLALDVLCDVHQNGAYAALSLNEHLQKAKLKPEDRRLVTGIVYGTLENELRIDFALDKLMDHPTHEAVQRDILRLSAYQILFLDRVPDSAAVNEAVKLVKIMGMESASGFINAVLRNLVRGKDELEWPKREDDLREYLRIMGSSPMWLVDKLIAAYGEEEAESVLMHRETAHPVTIRPNMMKLTDAELEALLEKKGQSYMRGVAPHAYLLSGVSEPGFDPDYQAGLYSIQGQSSMLAAEAVQAKPGMKVLDACAAPGGKSAYLCESMQMTGRVYAWELHEKRALLLEAAKRRLKLESLRISIRDATDYRDDLTGALDAVLLDAPCSGTGVMSQKPDIKLRLQESDIPAIVETQKKLLNTLCRYVKPGGTLVYSTCSILPEENIEQVKAFLSEHPDFSVEPLPLTFPEALRQRQTAYGLQLLGYRDDVEGFYIVRMRRAR